jgi:Putative threonine/serine exporter
VTKAQKTCILRLCRAWLTFGAPLSSIATRLRSLAQVFGVSLVVIGTPSAIMCVFQGLDDTKRPEIYYVQCDRRLSLRKLRQVDAISEQLVDCATHSLGTAMHLRIENVIGQLDKVLLEERKHKSTALTRVFKRLILSVYSFGVISSKRSKGPFRTTLSKNT